MRRTTHAQQGGLIASFDLSFEARQQALGLDSRFLPDPLALGISGSVSPKGTHTRLDFRLPRPHASTFLSPFAPRPLRRF